MAGRRVSPTRVAQADNENTFAVAPLLSATAEQAQLALLARVALAGLAALALALCRCILALPDFLPLRDLGLAAPPVADHRVQDVVQALADEGEANSH